MKTKSILGISALSLLAGVAMADKTHHWHELETAHHHVVESIHEMERVRDANHYDSEGHDAKAEDLLRQAEKELHEALEAARATK